MALDNLEQLEARIDQLLERHERIKREKELAEKKLQQKESESHQMKGQIRQYERERSEIREKLEKILGHFERLDLPLAGKGLVMKKAIDVEIMGEKFTVRS